MCSIKAKDSTFKLKDSSRLKAVFFANQREGTKQNDQRNVNATVTSGEGEKRKREKPNATIEEATTRENRSAKLARLCDSRLQSSQFRTINEYLYTHTSLEAKEYMNQRLFTAYHDAYSSIVNKWPIKPIDVIIKTIEDLSGSRKRLVIADMGCGKKPLLKLHFNSAIVHSFDFISAHEEVVKADITSVPLENEVCDFVVYCLSLMGTNLNDYIFEANRILKVNGTLLIAEVLSRFEDVDEFVKSLKCFGFAKAKVKELPPNKYFVLFVAVKNGNVKKTSKNVPQIELQPCYYKTR